MKELVMRLLKLAIWPLAAALVIGLYFAVNIKGYYRFKELCAKEAGLKVSQPLERGVGWLAHKNEAGYLLYFYKDIAFVRYVDEAQNQQDLIRTNEKNRPSDNGFRQRPVDITKQPAYEFDKAIGTVSGEDRLTKYQTTVTNLQNGKVSVAYQDFTYQLFSPDWGVAQGSACSSLGRRDSSERPTRAQETSIQNAFSSK